MQDLSLHILDVAENSIAARASQIEIRLEEDEGLGLLILEITDDGVGMDEAMAKAALDPFVTTKTTRRVGLGLPLLAQAAAAANGRLTLESTAGRGTRVRAVFELGHIDRKPLGDMGQTLTTLIAGNPQVDIVYTHKVNRSRYELKTREIKSQLGEVPIQSPEVIAAIRRNIKDGLDRLRRENEQR
jgi:hypothetical protein